MKIEILATRPSKDLQQFISIPIPAGPAAALVQEEVEWIDIDHYIRDGKAEVVYCRASGLSMQSKRENRIDDGDILAVLRSGFAEPGDIVVAEVNGEFTIKKLKHHAHGLYLVPANDDYPIRKVERSDTFSVWGVVIAGVHRFRRAA